MKDSGFLALGCALAGVALGQALEVANGHVAFPAMMWLTAAIVLAALALLLGRRQGLRGPQLLQAVLTLAVLVQLYQLANASPGVSLQAGTQDFLVFRLGVGAAAALTLTLSLVPVSRAWHVLLGLVLGVHFLLGCWIIRHAPSPLIDVFVIHRDSAAALLRGENPYAITFPLIYPTTIMYGPEQIAGGRLAFGYCYPPLSLLAALPGHLLGGDYRYSMLGAMTLTGLCLAYTRKGERTGALAALLLLFTPRVFYVVEHGWTDPLVALTLAATVLAARRAPRLLALPLGLFFAAKQYTVLALPAAVALLAFPLGRRRAVKLLAWTGAVTLAVTLPLFLIDPSAFIWDVVTLQFYSPFRQDAMSYLAWIAQAGGPRLSSLIGFTAVLPVAAYGVWRAPRTPAGFAAATALVYLVFFSLGKQAFSNYYFFVIAVLASACAAAPPAHAAAGEVGTVGEGAPLMSESSPAGSST